MHLVCLSAVKILILLWLHKGPLLVRLHSRNVKKLTSSLLNLIPYIPSDFVRKTREIQEVCRWKATEFKLFVLYTEPVVLNNILNKDAYTNFIALHVSMLVLLSPDYQQYVNYSKQLLNYFVQAFEMIMTVKIFRTIFMDLHSYQMTMNAEVLLIILVRLFLKIL